MNIEALIYATGVAAIMAVLILVIVLCVYQLAFVSTAHMVKKLVSLYRHVDLYYVMDLLMKQGHVKTLKDFEEGERDD